MLSRAKQWTSYYPAFWVRGTCGVIIIPTGAYLYYLSLFERVPITNRRRIIPRSMDDDEEVGYSQQRWMLSQREKQVLSQDSDITKLVREVLDQLLEVEVMKGIELKLLVFSDFGKLDGIDAFSIN